MTRHSKIPFTGPLALAVSMVISIAHAQTASDVVDLGTIVLKRTSDTPLENYEGYAAEASSTATRGLPGDLAKSPRSVTVVTREQVEDQGARSLEDAIAYTPGVTVQTYGSDSRYEQYAIRGYEGQSTSTYRDGMPLRTFGWGAWRTEVFGVERIEVLRGGTADLYGSNEPGGVVNAVTKRPQFTYGGEILTRLNSHGGGELGFDVTGPLSDTIAYRFVGLFGETGTVFDEVDEGRVYLAPSLTWKATDRTNITFFGQYQKDDVGDTYVIVPQFGSQLANPIASYDNDFYSGNPDRNIIETTQNYLGYELDHGFDNGLTFRSRARFAENDWINQTTYPAAFYSSTGVAGAVDSAIMTDFDVDQTTTQFSFDNALVKEFSFGNVSGQIIGGVDYYEAEYDNTYSFRYAGNRNLLTESTVVIPGIPVAADIEFTQDIKQVGYYLGANAEIADNWLVTVSLRHDRVDMTTVSSGFSQRNKTDYTTGNIGVSHTFRNGVTLYSNAGTSFNLPPVGVNASSQPLEVETATSYEIGARFRPLGSNSLLSIALFDVTKDNTTQLLNQFAGDPRVEQVGEIRSQGVEVSANYAFKNGVSVLANYTYNDAKITQNATNQGNRVARIPEHSASLWLNYDVQAPRFDGLSLGVGARFTGDRFSDSANTATRKISDLTVFDASVAYEWDDWSATLSARNLTDRQDVTFCTSGAEAATQAGLPLAEAGGCTYGTGRTIQLSLTRRF
ncbi:MAG: TonB-dependent siderophore receptor [Ascidiaceihabitans sp.]|uniref:TonB-dependent siderophore receptor n=1 Tax=Ascidiaceihabitans sp. TaxID=1872644 RepID=UPI00329725FA